MIEVSEHGGVFGAGRFRKGVDVYYNDLGLSHLPAVSNIIAERSTGTAGSTGAVHVAKFMSNELVFMINARTSSLIMPSVHNYNGSLLSSSNHSIVHFSTNTNTNKLYLTQNISNNYLYELDLPSLAKISEYNAGISSSSIEGFENMTDDSILIAIRVDSTVNSFRLIAKEGGKWVLKKSFPSSSNLYTIGLFKMTSDTAISMTTTKLRLINIDPLSTVEIISETDISSLGLSINRDTPLRYGIYSEYVNGYIYVHDGKGRIIKLTETGDVLATFDDVYAVPSGLNYSADNDRFYLLSGAGDKIHELDLNLQLKKSYPLLTGNGANTFLGGPYQGDGRFITGFVNVAEIKQSRFKLGG